jgi:hypothetical protein
LQIGCVALGASAYNIDKSLSIFETLFLAVIPGLTRIPGAYCKKDTGFPIGTLGNDEL